METHRSNTAAIVGGALLIVFGLLSLAGQIFGNSGVWSFLWPFIVIGVGAMFFVGMLAGGKSVAGLAIPGSIITGIGLLLFFQNVTHYWESWSYGWTLIIIFVGLGIFIMGMYSGIEERKQAGLRVMKTGLILFIIFGAFFELIFAAGNPLGLRSIAFPVLLIGLGIYLILSRSGILGRKKTASTEPPSAEPPSSGESLPPTS